MLDQIITVDRLFNATTQDALAGTQLDQPGVPGVYTIFIASDVADTTVTIRLGSRTITEDAAVVQRTNAEIQQNEDNFYQMLSRTGGRPVINITEVSAMSCRLRVIFLPAVAS